MRSRDLGWNERVRNRKIIGRARKDKDRIAKPLPLVLNMKSRNDITKKSSWPFFITLGHFPRGHLFGRFLPPHYVGQGNTVRLLMRRNNKEVSHFDGE
jgi:hypothetical protein